METQAGDTPGDGWIDLDLYCERYGERKNTVHKRVTDGVWERGAMLSSPSGGRCYVHEQRAKEWLASRGKLVEPA